MGPACTEHYIDTNGIRLHYIEYPDNGPLLLLMHGLTANAHAFDGLVAAGLADRFHLVSVDLRGRGLSDHPQEAYSQEDHAQDILGLMDNLGVAKANLCGHSFGGLLGLYLAATYPERIEKLIMLDAAVRLNPKVGEMLAHRISHLDVVSPSREAFLEEVKAAPYNTFWDDAMLSYYEADLKETEGGVMPRSSLATIIQASVGLSKNDWTALAGTVQAPVLLVNAPENYNLEEPLLPPAFAEETAALLAHGQLATVRGNHQTMLYGTGASQITAEIQRFLLG